MTSRLGWQFEKQQITLALQNNRQCVRCMQVKALDTFPRCYQGKARRWTCINCWQSVLAKKRHAKLRRRCLTQKKYYKAHRKERLQYEYSRYLRKQYGLSLEDYNTMLAKQNGVCAICLRPGRGGFSTLCVDHDHKTGKVRGLLCRFCNSTLGLMDENPNYLRSALTYLGY